MRMEKTREAREGEWVFKARCIRCWCWSVNIDVDPLDRPRLYADLDGAPFLSYYCGHCASVVTEVEAKELAEQARKDRKATNIA